MTGSLLLAMLLLGASYGQGADRAVGDRHRAAEYATPRAIGEEEAADGQLMLFLRGATGSLRVPGRASCDTYQIYFHVPISLREQAPVLLDVTCPEMIDYRFVRQDPPNLLVSARLKNADSTVLNWESWMLVSRNAYLDFPTYVPIPAPGELPDSVRQWLDATDCCQVSAAIVRSKADSIRDTTTNLIKVASDICHFCAGHIPGVVPHEPYAFDAVYSLKFGSSCTGHAHAAVALLRACGIPARPLLNILVGAKQDMHWIVDYYVPGYGWVRMESTLGVNPVTPQEELVVQACNPSDEFPVWFPCAIDAGWHSSDTAYGMWIPDWGLAHNGAAWLTMIDSSDRVHHAVALTDSVYRFYTSYWGIALPRAESSALTAALSHQSLALACIQDSELTGYIHEMQEALADYEAIKIAPVETLYSESFEGGSAGWTHGGSQDEWEMGTPSYGPARAHSGQSCWGTNLDGAYVNNDDCWLESPPIDLAGLACADLSFWIWNSVQDVYGCIYDPVWVEVSGDGETFRPLSSRMGGVNDDPEITAIGGWSRVVLDLSQYLGRVVQFRFRFQADGSTVFPGSYIDDVQVAGRRIVLPSVVRSVLLQPAVLGQQQAAVLLDISGRQVMSLGPGENDLSGLPAGVYFVWQRPGAAGYKPRPIRKVVVVK